MAKRKRMSALQRKYFGKRTTKRARRSALAAPRRSRRKGSSNKSTMGAILGAVAYGVGRQYLERWVQPVTSRIPAGQYSDEVVLGVASWAMSKGKIPLINKIPYSREIGHAGMIIEGARLGSGLVNGLNTKTITTNSTPTLVSTVY